MLKFKAKLKKILHALKSFNNFCNGINYAQSTSLERCLLKGKFGNCFPI